MYNMRLYGLHEQNYEQPHKAKTIPDTETKETSRLHMVALVP